MRVKGCISEYKWSGQKVNLEHQKGFGYIAQAHIPNQPRKKFDVKRKYYIIIGYCEHKYFVKCLGCYYFSFSLLKFVYILKI